MSYPTSQIEKNYVLYARMQNTKNLFSVLKAINFKEVSKLYRMYRKRRGSFGVTKVWRISKGIDLAEETLANFTSYY